MQHGQLDKQLLGVTVSESVRIIVPLATLKVHTVAVATVSRLFSHVTGFQIVADVELETESVDCNLAAARTVLHRARQESLREEETRRPENIWGTVVEPVLKESDSFVQILNPGSQRFQG